MRRVFSLALGLGAGLLIGAYVIRRLDEAQQAVAPTNLAGQAGRAAGAFAERVRTAAAAGPAAAAAREAELRAQFDVPGLRQAVGR
jgi:hypothetical protein